MCQRAVLVNLPKSESLDIEFSNIVYSAPLGWGQGSKQILKGVEGCFKSGELTGIMGPSGAGKSSLLNILTGFQQNNFTGKLNFRSRRKGACNWREYKKESCYIQQEDQLHPLFTVQEMMRMASHLKLGASLTGKAKQMIIDDVLEVLDLSKTKETRCDRLSGGQRKRLSIALELVDNPPVMFLDEPTTGLDSSAALQCLAMLQCLARGGRTIICTIHQPSAAIYEMLDHVYLLADGRCAYQGSAKNTVPYLAALGLQCPKYHNPADYMIEVASKEHGDFGERLAAAAVGPGAERWRAGSPAKSPLYHSDSLVKFNDENKTTVLVSQPSELYRFGVLFRRSLRHLLRDWTFSYLRLALHVLVGLLLGLTYTDAGSNGAKTVSNVCFLLVNVLYVGYTSLMPAALKFPQELPVLRKERFNNWYKLSTYYFAYLLCQLPVQLVYVGAYSVSVYFLSQQPAELQRFAMFYLVVFLSALVAESFGLAIGATVNPVNGTFLGAISHATFLVFAGFLVFFNHMPRFMYLFTYISYFRYAFEALVHAMYGFNRPNLPCPLPDNPQEGFSYCQFRIPKVVLKELSMVDNHYWRNILILIGYFLLIRLVAYRSLKNKLSTV